MEHLKIGKPPQADANLDLNGYDPDQVPDDESSSDDTPQDKSGFEFAPEVPQDPVTVEPVANSKDKRKQTKVVIIPQSQSSSQSQRRYPQRIRRQVVQYQHTG